MIKIPYAADKAITMLNSKGYQAYLVGGAVRNSIMGIQITDIDIATDALPYQTLQVFSDCKTVETGIKHGTVTIYIDNCPVEITTFRTETAYTDSRHPDSVAFTGSLKKDCTRRDFTMNAVCYNTDSGIVDYYGGVDDIHNRLIRCVGDADKRFGEDALRILRAVRFASVLGFEIEQNTKESVFSNAYLLKNISPERIYEELKKLLCGKHVKRVLMEYIDVLAVIIPELIYMKGFDQRNYHHIYDVLEHTAVAVENTPPVYQLRIAALLHDIGKPHTFTVDEKGIGHFYGHGDVSFEMTQHILRRLKVSNEDYNLISKLVKYHDTHIRLEEKAVLRALNKHGEEFVRQLLLLKRADNAGQNIKDFNRREEYDTLESIINKVTEQQKCFSLKQLAVKGDDLIALGIPQSQEIGRLLDIILQMVINGEIPNKKEVLIDKIMEIIQKNNVLFDI